MKQLLINSLFPFNCPRQLNSVFPFGWNSELVAEQIFKNISAYANRLLVIHPFYNVVLVSKVGLALYVLFHSFVMKAFTTVALIRTLFNLVSLFQLSNYFFGDTFNVW